MNVTIQRSVSTQRPSKKRRPSLRYRLRGLFALVFVAAIPAWWAGSKLDQFAYEHEAIFSLGADGAQIRTVPASPAWLWNILPVSVSRRCEHALALDLQNGGIREVSDRHLAIIGRLSELRSLTVLNLDGNEDRLEPCRALTELRHLNVSGCRAVTDAGLRNFAGAKHLRTLHAVETDITDASAGMLAKFGEVESLSLQGTTLGNGSMNDLRKLSRLESLGLPATVSLPGLRQLAGMDALAQLDVWILPGDEIEIIEVLSGLPRVRHLTLRGRDGSRLGGREFKAISSMLRLESLDIRDAAIVAADLEELKLAPSLRSVQLSRTGLDEHVGDWRARLGISFVSAHDEGIVSKWVSEKSDGPGAAPPAE